MRYFFGLVAVVATATLQAAPQYSIEHVGGGGIGFDLTNDNDQFVRNDFFGSARFFDGESWQRIGADADKNNAVFLNNYGQVAGYGRASFYSSTIAWVYDAGVLKDIGPTGASYIRGSDGYRYSTVKGLADTGAVLGSARRFAPDGSDQGTTETWYYDGSQTTIVGLSGSDYTAANGSRISDAFAMSKSGQAFGTSRRYTESSNGGNRSAWVADGSSTTQIGLFDSLHEQIDGRQSSTVIAVNDTGNAVGTSQRFNASRTANRGLDAWLYNGTASQQIGLYSSEFTRPNGYRDNQVNQAGLTNSGKVVGSAKRYDAGGNDVGTAAWIFDGSSTNRIGLTDAEHTRDTDSNQFSYVSQDMRKQLVNEAGYVAGQSERYVAGGALGGVSAWLYDGSTTAKIGLVDAEHTNVLTGEMRNEALSLSESGRVAGTAKRFGAGGDDAGASVWLFDGIDSTNIGLTDAEHTNNGYRSADFVALNEAGQAIGGSARYVGESIFGDSNTAWFYNGTETISLFAPVDDSYSGFSASFATHLTEDGMVFGVYWTENSYSGVYGELDARVFGYSEELGVFDLLASLDGSALEIGIVGDQDFRLVSLQHIYNDGSLMARSVQTVIGGGTGSADYKLTPVPVPAAVWLFGSGLMGLGWLRKKATQQ